MEITGVIGQSTTYVLITLLDTLGGIFLITFIWILVSNYLLKREARARNLWRRRLRQ